MKKYLFLLLFLVIMLGTFSSIWGQVSILSQNFEGVWTVPSTLSPAWSGTTTATTQWHSNDYTTGWNYPSSGGYTPTGANSTTKSARYHTYGITAPGTSDFITPLMDWSISAAAKTLTFYYINASGTDNVKVYLSTDGGTSYGSALYTTGVSTIWTLVSVDLGTSTSNTVLIKFTATSDYGNDDIGIDEVNVTYLQAGLPGVVTNPNPSNFATGVALDGNLTWTWGADTATYDLWFGPTGSMTKVVDDQAIGTASYTYPTLSSATAYSWQVVSRNSNARFDTAGPVWYFTTGIVPPWTETVETTSPTIAAWTYLAGSGSWQISTSASGYGTGVRSFKANFMDINGTTPFHLYSPTFDTGVTSHRLKFDYAYATYVAEVDQMDVYYSLDNGSSYNLLLAMPGGLTGILNTGGATTSSFVPSASQWATQTLVLPIGTNRLRFTATSAYGNDLFLDNVTVEEVPSAPSFDITPGNKLYGYVQIGTTTAAQVFTISNGGGGTLTINPAISVTGDASQFVFTDTNVYPKNLNLANGLSMTVSVAFAPTSLGEKTAYLHIVDNITKTTHDIELKGTAIDATIYSLPFSEYFDGVTPPALPLGWNYMIQPTGGTGYVRTGTTYNYSAPNSVVFYSGTTTGSNTTLIAPPLGPAIPVSGTWVRFWARGSVSGYVLSVGVMSDPFDASTFLEVHSCVLTSTFTEFILPMSPYTGSGQYIALKVNYTSSAQNIFVDDFMIVSVSDPPPPATIGYPPNGNWCFINANLTWSGVFAVGYDVYLDTVNPPVTLVSDNQPGTSFTPSLVPGTQYYWQVVPYNANGSTLGCPVWSFRTPAPNQLAEDFETWTPTGWLEIYGAWGGWGIASPGFHGNYSMYENTDTASLVSTPLIAITEGYALDFWISSGTTTGYGRLQIQYSSDRTTWYDIGPLISFPPDLIWHNCVVNVNSLAGGNYYLGFKAWSAAAPTNAYMYIDHVFGSIPFEYPYFIVAPISKDFGQVAIGATSPPQQFIISNGGLGSLTIDPAISITGPDAAEFSLTDSNAYPCILTAGQSISVNVAFAPVSVGAKSANLRIVDNLSKTTEHLLLLTGTGADFKISDIPHIFTFTPATDIQLWVQNGSSTAVEGLWYLSDSNLAGGTIPELHHHWPSGSVTDQWTRLVTPPIDVTGLDEVIVKYLQWFDVYGTGLTLKFQYSTDGINFTDLWSQAVTTNLGPEEKSFTIDLTTKSTGSPDNYNQIDNMIKSTKDRKGSLPELLQSIPIGGRTVPTRDNYIYLAWYTFGDQYNIDAWNIDNIRILLPNTQINQGVAVGGATTINIPPITNLSNMQPLSTTVAVTNLTNPTAIVNADVAYSNPDITLPNDGLYMNLTGDNFNGAHIVITHNLGFVPIHFMYRVNGGGWVSVPAPTLAPLWTTMESFFDIFYPVKAGDRIEMVFPTTEDVTLAVELSSFTAVLTSAMYVQIAWVTQSETNHMGYNVLRNTDGDLDTAIQLNNGVISNGSANGTEVSYAFVDSEVDQDESYYYWLQSMDLNGASIFYGPLAVTISGQPEPELPLISLMSSAYPNPFRMGTSTSINVSVKKGETGKVTIYNVKGQLVKTFEVKQGVNKLTWTAQGCASGIYLYNLSTPSVNNTKKLVIIN